MAVWQFELDPVPARATLIDGVPAIQLGADVRDTILLDLDASQRKQLIAAFDALLPAGQSWGAGLMVWGNTRGSDVQFYLGEDGADSLKIRIDAKTFTTDLLVALCDIAVRFDWVFLTEGGSVLQPAPEAVLRALLKSPARAFVEDPQGMIAAATARSHAPA